MNPWKSQTSKGIPKKGRHIFRSECSCRNLHLQPPNIQLSCEHSLVGIGLPFG